MLYFHPLFRKNLSSAASMVWRDSGSYSVPSFFNSAKKFCRTMFSSVALASHNGTVIPCCFCHVSNLCAQLSVLLSVFLLRFLSFKHCSSWALLGPGNQRMELVGVGKWMRQCHPAILQAVYWWRTLQVRHLGVFKHVGCIEKFGNRRQKISALFALEPVQKSVITWLVENSADYRNENYTLTWYRSFVWKLVSTIWLCWS